MEKYLFLDDFSHFFQSFGQYNINSAILEELINDLLQISDFL